MFDELVARQHGVLTRQQAYACGVTKAQVEARVRGGRWQLLGGGVIAISTGDPPRRAQLWAAVLRAGRGAVISHDTAAELQGLNERASPVVHVTVPGHRRVTPTRGVGCCAATAGTETPARAARTA